MSIQLSRSVPPAAWTLALLMFGLTAYGGGGDTPAPAPAPAPANFYYQTKTPYAPQQDAATYEAAPAGYSTVYTELMARHGSRGLSSL